MDNIAEDVSSLQLPELHSEIFEFLRCTEFLHSKGQFSGDIPAQDLRKVFMDRIDREDDFELVGKLSKETAA